MCGMTRIFCPTYMCIPSGLKMREDAPKLISVWMNVTQRDLNASAGAH